MESADKVRTCRRVKRGIMLAWRDCKIERVRVSTAVLEDGTMNPIFFAVVRSAITGAGILWSLGR